MARIVHCKKYQKDMEGLETPPYPGPKGQEIFETVSKQAWQEWLAHQTMIINERQLNMMDPKARKFLNEQLEKFLANEEFASAEGYVPPSRDQSGN